MMLYQYHLFIKGNCLTRILASQECWEKLEGSFELTTIPSRLVFYLEGPPAGVDLLIDSVTISCKVCFQLLYMFFFWRELLYMLVCEV